MFKKNTAVLGFKFHLYDAEDGSDIILGTPVGYYTVDNSPQAAIGDVTPVHKGNGTYAVDLTAGEMNGDVISLDFVLAGAITAHFEIKTSAKLVADLQDTTAIQNADTLLDRDMSVGADSGSTTVRTVRQALRFLRNKWGVAGTTLTVNKEDDTTTSWTSTVSTNASADPITGSDPA